MLSGLFFIGCDDNLASKITLSSDVSSISLFAGSSQNITFTIGNYDSSIDANLDFAIIDSAAGNMESEHVKLEVVSQNGNITVVEVTGKSGGNATLVASTREGNKSTSVQIEVKQYSENISLKSNSLLFVSNQSPFVPSESYFEFDDNSTERQLRFFRADFAEAASEDNAFEKVEIGKKDGRDVLIFTRPNSQNLDEEQSTFTEPFSEGRVVNFITKYEKGEGEEETLIATFSALSGFENDSEIGVFEDEE